MSELSSPSLTAVLDRTLWNKQIYEEYQHSVTVGADWDKNSALAFYPHQPRLLRVPPTVEAAEGRTAENNGRRGANGMASNTWFPNTL